jgi:uncharacterized SAM-binding protein YcdF (DUF218 family)
MSCRRAGSSATERSPVPTLSRKGCLLAAALHLFGGVLVIGAFVLTVGRFLTAADPPGRADAIVVLGGGDPNRVYHAVSLFDQGFAPTVVFSGGQLKDVGLACSSAQLSLEAARELGLPEGAAIIAPEAQSTYDEAVNLRRLSEERGWRALIVVTDPFHTRRAGRTFRALLPGVTVHVSAAPNPDHDPARWWQNEYGLLAVVDETIKLAFYWVKYGIAPL